MAGRITAAKPNKLNNDQEYHAENEIGINYRWK